MSYSKLVYNNMTVTNSENGAEISVMVTNESDIDGVEIVQLYFKDVVCKMLTPIRSMIDFKRVVIAGRESVTVHFSVSREQLGYYNEDCKLTFDEGDFKFFISFDGLAFIEKTIFISKKVN